MPSGHLLFNLEVINGNYSTCNFNATTA